MIAGNTLGVTATIAPRFCPQLLAVTSKFVQLVSNGVAVEQGIETLHSKVMAVGPEIVQVDSPVMTFESEMIGCHRR